MMHAIHDFKLRVLKNMKKRVEKKQTQINIFSTVEQI